MLDYSGFATKVRGLGPGERVVLWVRGCTIGCPGCMTSDLWASGEARPIELLAEQLLQALEASDGLSISGGEPFQQPRSVATLVRRLRVEKPDLNVLCYSGFTLNHILRHEDMRELLGTIDVLIDGPYREKDPNTKQWRGSDNQRAYAISNRDSGDLDLAFPEQRELQVQRTQDGSVRVIGIPKRADFEKLKEVIGARGLVVKEAP